MIQKSTTQEVLGVLFDEPTETHYLKEISRKIKKAHTSITNSINDLLKEKLVIKEYEEKGKRKFPIFRANLESADFKKMKKVWNLEKLYSSGLVKELYERIMPKSVILFGSYSRGEDVEVSDVDIFVESKKESVELKKYEKILKRKINLLFGSVSTLEKNLKENILNGIVLEGVIEL